MIAETKNYYTDLYKEDISPLKRRVMPLTLGNVYRLEQAFNTNDSPAESRKSILKRFLEGTNLTSSSIVLDLGAGRQIVEAELEADKTRRFIPDFTMITLDNAEIPSDQLLINIFFPERTTRYPHLIADAANLPIQNNSLDAAISNMALDFMPEEAKFELFRVLKPNAPLFLNLHHPKLIPENLDQEIANIKRKIFQRSQRGGRTRSVHKRINEVLSHHKWLRENNCLFENPNQIQNAFEQVGFTVSNINLKTDKQDVWWEVDMIKF